MRETAAAAALELQATKSSSRLRKKKKGTNTRGTPRVTGRDEPLGLRKAHPGALKDLLWEADITITYSHMPEDPVLLHPGCPS